MSLLNKWPPFLHLNWAKTYFVVTLFVLFVVLSHVFLSRLLYKLSIIHNMTRLPKQNGTTNFIDLCKVRKEPFCYVRAKVVGNWQLPFLIWQLTSAFLFKAFSLHSWKTAVRIMNNRDIMLIGHYEKTGN